MTLKRVITISTVFEKKEFFYRKRIYLQEFLILMIYYLFNAQRLVLKLTDVILAKVLAPSAPVDKKKSGKTSSCDYSEKLPGK